MVRSARGPAGYLTPVDNLVPADAALLARIESCYDAIPRDQARAEEHGPFVLFVREGPGWPFYARPQPAATGSATVSDVIQVRDRQRRLGIPEAFEWVHELVPNLLPIVEEAGLSVLRAPLMVFDPDAEPPRRTTGTTTVRLVDPTTADFAEDLAIVQAVTSVAFHAPGTASGPAGPTARERARKPADPDQAAWVAAQIAAGRLARVVAETPDDGAVAVGSFQRVDDAAEIVAVATLPVARRRGLGAAVTARLVDHARSRGVDLVFLSAASDDVARMYAGLGFRRVGTACIAEVSDLR